ncbi:MAG: ArsR family transcriptional regulator [Caldilineae bacterium]|nr:MAG: ArsR family transcriptional regulator [Caldilineae bacterium]
MTTLRPQLQAALVHPVRQKILEILKRQGHATVGELAEHLEMAPVSVRHHLDLLIGDNLVWTPRTRRTPGAGRPQRVYALTEEAHQYFPNNYQQLAEESLRILKELLTPEQMDEVMTTLAQRTAAQAPSGLTALPPCRRIEAAVGFLSSLGYMAEYEVSEGTALLHTCNCPYAQLASPHGELCLMDLHLIRLLTGLDPQRVAHITDGDVRCSYRMTLADAGQPQSPALALDLPIKSVTNA